MRIERDSMGEMQVPDDAYYGASTQRAVENFPISDLRFGRRLIAALGMIKSAAAEENASRGIIPADVAKAVRTAAEEVVAGTLDSQFVLDVFQTGSGTSSNMNANEVIANRANELLGEPRGSKKVHPNDHVNAGQSSNDVIPAAIHIAAVAALREDTIPALTRLAEALDDKAEEFDHIVKTGRTHLMDATPIRLGQEFSGYAAQVRLGAQRLELALPGLEELALGGTAVGTGINTPAGFAAGVIARMAERTGYPFQEAANHFEAQAAKDAAVFASGALKTVAVSMFKVANDLRWLGSGPRTAIGEISLPATQPGSSIMPGKVNPVMTESVMQVAAQVIGNDAAITWAGANGNFELNVMMPVLAHNLIESAELIGSVADAFREKCVVGIKANEARAAMLLDQN
ncbi:MAG: aspartate ammonia-lyase, partial [Actinobacteria bacterium RBG_16_67_15]